MIQDKKTITYREIYDRYKGREILVQSNPLKISCRQYVKAYLCGVMHSMFLVAFSDFTGMLSRDQGHWMEGLDVFEDSSKYVTFWFYDAENIMLIDESGTSDINQAVYEEPV